MPTTRPTAAELAAWRAFLQAHAALRYRLEEELCREHGLSLSWYEVLLRLAEAPEGRLRMNDLVSCALMTKSGVSRLADRMETAGLIRRETCPSDRRGAFAVLTPEGRQRLRRAAPTHLDGIQRHFAGHLSPEETATLEAAFTRIIGDPSAAQATSAGCGEDHTER